MRASDGDSGKCLYSAVEWGGGCQNFGGFYFRAFKKMHENGEDKLLINDVFEEENLEEWI